MSKRCVTFEHTADIGLEARADSLGELFEALAEGLTDVICVRERVRPTETRGTVVRAEDVEALAVDFLSEVRSLLEMQRFLPAAVRVREIDDNAVVAEYVGEPYDLSRHELRTEVKAVTYHQLKISHEDDGWIGRVILDV